MVAGVINELRQRSVIRVAGFYAVGGWAVFQVANALFPVFDFPKWSVTLVALLFLGGFPIVMLLAWLLELTPEGIRMTPRGKRSFGSGRFGWADWASVAVAIALLAFVGVQAVNLVRSTDGPMLSLGGVPRQSVAVLPFASFSSRPDDEFFADGLTEEIINSLAQTRDLKVAGRTSAFYFKDRNEDIRAIGRKLGVAHVLEGSVRRAGDKLRVTAQLISVDDGFHLWSATYDRDMRDVLAIQTEVAGAVADKLEAQLAGTAASGSALDGDAARRALIAKAQLRTQELANLTSARQTFDDLRRTDPGNAELQAGFAQATTLLAQNFLALDFATAQRESEAAINKALRLDPKSPEAWRARGLFERVMSIRAGGSDHADHAIRAFRRAIELAPSDPELRALLANQLLTAGQDREAVTLLRSAVAADPLSRTSQHLLASALAAAGDLPAARRQYERVVAMFPSYTSGRVAFAQMLMFQQGQFDQAVVLLDDSELIAQDPLAAFLLANCYANLGMRDAVRETIGRVARDSPAAAIGQAALLQVEGRSRDVLALASRTYRSTRDPIWRAVQIVQQALLGDFAAARTSLPTQQPGVFATPPRLADIDDLDLAIAAVVLRRTGDPALASRLLNDRLNTPIINSRMTTGAQAIAQRAYVLAAAGRTEEAVATFERAAAAGWRMTTDFEYFVRVDRYPFMAEVARHPRFNALIRKVDADLARMRALVEKRGLPPERAA